MLQVHVALHRGKVGEFIVFVKSGNILVKAALDIGKAYVVANIDEAGLDPSFYANRRMGLDEVLPWDVIDCGVTKEFLVREYKKAYEEKTTASCREKCSGCGANRLGGERSCCPKKVEDK